MNGYDHGIHRSVMSRSIPTENISTAQRSWGNTHTKKERWRERKKEKTIQQQRQMASTYTFVIFFALVCVCVFVWGGWCGTYIYNGGLAWLVPSMNIRRSRIQKTTSVFTSSTRATPLCVPLLSLYPTFFFLFQHDIVKTGRRQIKFKKKKRLWKSRQRAKSCVGALARMRRKMIIPFRVYKTKRRRENTRRCR